MISGPEDDGLHDPPYMIFRSFSFFPPVRPRCLHRVYVPVAPVFATHQQITWTGASLSIGTPSCLGLETSQDAAVSWWDRPSFTPIARDGCIHRIVTKKPDCRQATRFKTNDSSRQLGYPQNTDPQLSVLRLPEVWLFWLSAHSRNAMIVPTIDHSQVCFLTGSIYI